MIDGLARPDEGNRLLPGHNRCALPGAAITGEITGSPIPIPTPDGAIYLAAGVAYGETWAVGHNSKIWGAWCNDATGYSFED
jgi:hypothetical protein